MTLDESRAFIAQDCVIWPSATAKRTRHVVLGNEGIKMKKITRSF